jgi:hypothetical protein
LSIHVVQVDDSIAGGEGWEDIEEYGISKQEWLKTFLQLPFGIPSPDT